MKVLENCCQIAHEGQVVVYLLFDAKKVLQTENVNAAPVLYLQSCTQTLLWKRGVQIYTSSTGLKKITLLFK